MYIYIPKNVQVRTKKTNIQKLGTYLNTNSNLNQTRALV